jgi:C4-dicarboxylate transporter DctM subunit
MMSTEAVGGLGVAVLLALLALGVPIGTALTSVGAVGLAVLLSPEAALIKSSVIAFDTVSRYELGVLPLFLLMAHLCFSAGASRDFFNAASRLIGHRPGGLALGSIGACAGFGAISGSSLATAATVGAVALPEMRRHGYSPAFATGVLAAGGTLGSLVPPSAALIVFGIIAEQSIGKLFMASIVPAATQVLFYVVAIMIMCRLRPALGPPSRRADWRDRGAALARVWDLALLILLVIGGLAAGWFTPTEAASVGCVGAFALCAWRRTLSFESVGKALREALRTTGMIYFVLIGALVFSTFISVSGLTREMSEAVAGLHAGPIVGAVAMAAVLLVLGSFLDGMALMLLTTPILLPIALKLGLSPIWFGIFLVRTMEIGFIHPPVGMNVYVIHGLAKDIPLTTIFRGIVPFLLVDFLHLAMLIVFPAMVLFLPSVTGA